MRHVLALALLALATAAPARADGIVGPIPFSLPTTDGKATLTGELALPGGVPCLAPEKPKPGEKPKERLPVALLVPGSGEFDRDEDFGVSGTEKDLLFRQLSYDLLSQGLAVVRFDYRGVHCNRFSLPTGAATSREELLRRCVDAEIRPGATPEAMRSDLRQAYEYAASRECLDPKNIVVIAHSEGSFHVAPLIQAKAIAPKALLLIGGVAESPKSLVHWQSVDRELARVMRGASDPDRITNAEILTAALPGVEPAPQGYRTRAEIRELLEKSYEKLRAEAMAEPDNGPLHRGFWPESWWKMWWSDDTRVLDELRGYPGAIVLHGGDQDTQVPQEREQELFRAEAKRFAQEPKLILHVGLGHSLGRDPLKGPMDPDAAARVAEDAAKLVGLKPGEILPPLSGEELSERAHMGIGLAISEPLPRSLLAALAKPLPGDFGLRVTGVTPALPAWEGGVRQGDVILAMDGEAISSAPKEDALVRFIKRVQALKPGTDAKLSVLRWKAEAEALQDGKKKEPPSLSDTAPLETIALAGDPDKPYTLELRKNYDLLELGVSARLPRKILDESPGPKPALEALAEKLAAHYRIERQYSDLKRRIAEMTARPDPFRLAAVDHAQHHPFTLGESAKRIARAAAPAPLARFPAIPVLAQALALRYPDASPLGELPPLRTGLSPEEHLAQIRGLLKEADNAWFQAFRDLKDPQVEFLRQNIDGLVQKFEQWNYVYADPDLHRLERNSQTLALLARIDLAPLIRAAASLSRLADPDYVRGLKGDLERAGKNLAAHEVLRESTPYGAIVIGGTGDDAWPDLEQQGVAVLIDLGGNDYYANRVASSSPKLRASVVVDLEGDDVYESNQDWAQGAGFLGIGILADLGGSDEYTGIRGAQAAGIGGVGLLIDRAGDDAYRARSLSQGMGFFGVGALVDMAGDDRYEARLLSQAVGVAGGIGALIDLEGDDRYFAKGATPSGYGTPGTYEGWSQGIGIGLRFLASGGLGLLYDGDGHNVFEGGDFSQGGGYWFGWGILDAAGAGDDTYVGSRYSQGFAAHSALGAFIDEGGNDRYESRGNVSTGNANDLSVAWFEDERGDDRYPARHFSLGASANNSICVFLDRGGRDRFAGGLLPASGQVNDYHGGKSLSLFVALGPGPRLFDKEPRSPVDAWEGYGFALQGARSLEELLQGEPTWPPLRELP